MLGTAIALGTLLFLSGCEPESPPTTALTREEYIEVYIEILRAASEEQDSAAATERAREIIASRGYAPADLAEFARRHAEDPGYLAEVWAEIEMRLRQQELPDTTEGK